MIKHTWLAKLRNFHHVPSNLSSKVIHGFFGWDWLNTHIPKRSNFDWFVVEQWIHGAFDFPILNS
jgi:hypothetical protein